MLNIIYFVILYLHTRKVLIMSRVKSEQRPMRSVSIRVSWKKKQRKFLTKYLRTFGIVWNHSQIMKFNLIFEQSRL